MRLKAPPRIADLPAHARKAPEATAPTDARSIPRSAWVQHECEECGVFFDAPPGPVPLCGLNCRAIRVEVLAQAEEEARWFTTYETIWERDDSGEIVGPLHPDKLVKVDPPHLVALRNSLVEGAAKAEERIPYHELEEHTANPFADHAGSIPW